MQSQKIVCCFSLLSSFCFHAIRSYYFRILRLALFISALFLREWFTVETMQLSKDFGCFPLRWRSLLLSTRFSLEFHQHSVTSLESHLSVKIDAYRGHGGFWMRNCCVKRLLKQKIFTNLSLCLIVEPINLIWWNLIEDLWFDSFTHSVLQNCKTRLDFLFRSVLFVQQKEFEDNLKD